MTAKTDSHKLIANWVINEVLRETTPDDLAEFKVTPAALAGLVRLIEDKTISGKIAKVIFQILVAEGGDPAQIVADRGLEQMIDTAAIASVIDQLIADNPESSAEFRAGKERVLGWFVGHAMRVTSGKANPHIVNQLLREKLGAHAV